MAKDIYLDVLLEVPVMDLATVPDPGRFLMEKARDRADELCAESGARLRTDRAPEVTISQAKHVLGPDMTLVATRWAVVAPDSLETVNIAAATA